MKANANPHGGTRTVHGATISL
ncbi:MAG: hypothetical protein RJA59_1588, partial [Pseudomonadota bacterium]